jgi:hypothetical protein
MIDEKFVFPQGICYCIWVFPAEEYYARLDAREQSQPGVLSGQPKVKESVAKHLPHEETAELTRGHAESGYMANDWSKSPNGEDYRKRLGDRGRTVVLDWVDNWARPRLQAINKRWQARIEGRKAAEELPTPKTIEEAAKLPLARTSLTPKVTGGCARE